MIRSITQGDKIRMTRAIEHEFPAAELDRLAEAESWRKEIYRPMYSIHKWWAKRLGTVFRAISLGSTLDSGKNTWSHFYDDRCGEGKVILDPFMGSGTTLGEAIKLGMKPIGCDINPVSSFIVRQSLTRVSIDELESELESIEKDTSHRIKKYYKTTLPSGEEADVLYFFWVKTVDTPDAETLSLFSSYVFSKNAYASKKPKAKILCPSCWEIVTDRYDSTQTNCCFCGHIFNPQSGPAKGQFVYDSKGTSHKIKSLVWDNGSPPRHKLYALMALTKDGEKVYLKPTEEDLQLYDEARKELEKIECDLPLPNMEIRPGHNTNQARSYQYKNWRDFFNDRQLLCLGILLQRIKNIPKKDIREAFLCLFSGALEFNNMFCSFKGEGTGAVRHLFSHHILKPERVPLENNVWGTKKSSGSFTSLFKSRLIKAKEYLDSPFELSTDHTKNKGKINKVPLGREINCFISSSYEEFEKNSDSALVLNGDSSNLPIPDSCVDAVVTDPPYFDFIHYSELSDFFYAWLSPALKSEYEFFGKNTSGDDGEVQQSDPLDFSRNLGKVFLECHRVMKPDAVLVFSFHHSRPEGWLAIYNAVCSGKLTFVAAHPVKAEMSVSSPKSGTRDPINLDAILVCKKVVNEEPEITGLDKLSILAKLRMERLESFGRKLTESDKRVVLAGEVLVYSSRAGLDNTSTKNLLEKVYESNSKELLNTWMNTSCTETEHQTDIHRGLNVNGL